MPLRLGNLRCGGAAGGGFCRNTKVSPSPYLWLCCRAQDRRDGRRETRREGKARQGKGKGSAAQFVANKGLGFVVVFTSPFFLCKKCRKAGQLFARSVMFPEGRGKEGPRPVNPAWD